MKIIITVLLLLMPLLWQTPLRAQIGIPVFDPQNNLYGAVSKFVASASEVIRRDILPWKERISKVQNFFRGANEKISAVVKNMKMTGDLVATRGDIKALFFKAREQIGEAENLPEKWKHIWVLTNLYYGGTRVFDVFDLSYEEGESVMDDAGRVRITRDMLKKARVLRRSMKSAIRRANRDIFRLGRQKKELEFYARLFATS